MKVNKKIATLMLLVFLVTLVIFLKPEIFTNHSKTNSVQRGQSNTISQSINKGKLKVTFPAKLPVNQDITDCSSQSLITKGSLVFTTGALIDNSEEAEAFFVGMTETQINPSNNLLQQNLCAHTGVGGVLFQVQSFSKEEGQVVAQSLIDPEDEYMSFKKNVEINIGNISTTAAVYVNTRFVVHEELYYFEFGGDYYLITKPLYGDTVDSFVDENVFNEAIDYIWSHLEFTQN